MSTEVYPRTIHRTLGLAGRDVATVTQFGSANLAGVIEGDKRYPLSLSDQVEADVRGLTEAHRAAGDKSKPIPLKKIMLGCTHFPLVTGKIDTAFAKLRNDPAYQPWIAAEREFVNPAEWTARELFRELAKATLRSPDGPSAGNRADRFFISVANRQCPEVTLTAKGGLDHTYKYGREKGRFGVEDTIVVPMTRAGLSEVSRRLLETKLPAVWERLPKQ